MLLNFNESNKHVQYRESVQKTISNIIEKGGVKIKKYNKDKDECKEETLTPSSNLHLVYIALYSFNYSGVNNCCPTYEQVGKKININKSTVMRCIRILEYYNVIITINSETYRGHTLTKYFFPLEYNLYDAEQRNEFKLLLTKEKNGDEAWNDFYNKHLLPLIEDGEIEEDIPTELPF